LEPRFDKRPPPEPVDLGERRKGTYIQIAQPGRGLAVAAWLAALLVVVTVGVLALYAVRYEYFVMANGGYVLRMNRFTGKVCYIPADPEWERVLEGRQALLDRCWM
jgi:hypothetical protein